MLLLLLLLFGSPCVCTFPNSFHSESVLRSLWIWEHAPQPSYQFIFNALYAYIFLPSSTTAHFVLYTCRLNFHCQRCQWSGNIQIDSVLFIGHFFSLGCCCLFVRISLKMANETFMIWTGSAHSETKGMSTTRQSNAREGKKNGLLRGFEFTGDGLFSLQMWNVYIYNTFGKCCFDFCILIQRKIERSIRHTAALLYVCIIHIQHNI